MASTSFIFWIVDSIHFLGLSIGIIGDNEFHRVENSTDTCGLFVQVFTHTGLQESHIVEGIKLGISDRVNEHTYTFRAVATATHTAECRHTWVIPTIYKVFVDQRMQFTLAHHGVGEVQTVELYLAGTVVLQVICSSILFFQKVNELVI